ncbi:MAG: nucleotidyltransferase domain-containing protein [Chitinivibrionia bacterium]|jgi:predicted nucleotidyltransferase|nr:nucleotidyltransferase domain-containing protein [Chitinivibrionia bacterium]
MRISVNEKNAIVKSVKKVDEAAKIWLFGSRADDTKKGGDIDIAVLSGVISRKNKYDIVYEIEKQIGEQKIDFIVCADYSKPFFKMATESGVRIDE